MDGLIQMQAAQKPQKRRAKFDELRRTLQYVEASRASATKHMRLFSSLLALQKRHPKAHQIVEGIPMHHVLAAIDDV